MSSIAVPEAAWTTGGPNLLAPNALGRLRAVLWQDGSARGERWVAFIEQVVGSLAGKAALDVGCATGGMTRVLAARAAWACGVDNCAENVCAARARAPLSGGGHVLFVHADVLDLPIGDRTFDVALMSGVLEWVPWAQRERAPSAAQLAALRELHRVLKPAGRLFVGIENRWFPKFLLRSPHQRLPLGLLWPASVAWRLPRWVYGEPVRERLYGPWGLGRLLRRAGFRRVDVFIPLFDYQFPRVIVPGSDRTGLLAALQDLARPPRDDYERMSTGGRRGRRWMRFVTQLGVQRWFAPCLIVVGERTG